MTLTLEHTRLPQQHAVESCMKGHERPLIGCVGVPCLFCEYTSFFDIYKCRIVYIAEVLNYLLVLFVGCGVKRRPRSNIE
jgi:hypothetical protein